MAKDRRKKTAAAKTAGATAKPRKPRSGNNRGKRILWISIAAFVVLAIVFAIVIISIATAQNNAQKAVPNTVYPTLPNEMQGDVAYYVVGLLGEEEISTTTSLMLLCHDKKANTMNVLEVPQATYLGDSELWSVKKAGDVWGNPAPLDWCDYCGKRLFKAEMDEHREEPHKLTQKVGSARYGLISIFNEQYSLPIDGYFMIPQEAFVKLIDLLGGIELKLDADITLNEIKFTAGIRTLDGLGALEYITMGEDSVKADLQRTARRRQVFVAVFQRLCAQTDNQLQVDSLIPVMKGSTPIRTSTEQEDMIKIVQSWRSIQPAKVTMMLVPGEATTYDGVAYYSVYRQQLIEVLNTYFNPYDGKITEKDVQVTELVTGGKADVQLQTMDKIAVEQKLIRPAA